MLSRNGNKQKRVTGRKIGNNQRKGGINHRKTEGTTRQIRGYQREAEKRKIGQKRKGVKIQ